VSWFFHLDWIFLDLDFNTGLVFFGFGCLAFSFGLDFGFSFSLVLDSWFFIGIRNVARLSDVKLQLLMIHYKQ
jgi:hypothetical protein